MIRDDLVFCDNCGTEAPVGVWNNRADDSPKS